jgi:hypothetical protein
MAVRLFFFGAGNIGDHPITGSFNFDENGKVVVYR